MSRKTKLKYSKDGGKTWEKSKTSNINNGSYGVMFEDSRGTLWSMGQNNGLQYSTDGETWKKSQTSNIKKGDNGMIFEDSKGTLWSMGLNTKLQSLKLKDQKLQLLIDKKNEDIKLKKEIREKEIREKEIRDKRKAEMINKQKLDSIKNNQKKLNKSKFSPAYILIPLGIIALGIINFISLISFKKLWKLKK